MNKYKIEDLENKLIECKNKKIEEININEIDNLSNINIDRKKKGNDRILDFINKVSNPYMFNICGKIVKFEFLNEKENGKLLTAEDSITNIISRVYK